MSGRGRYDAREMSTPLRHLARRIIWGAAAAAILLAGLAGGARWYQFHRFDGLIESTARAAGLPPRLVRSVVWRESRFDPRRVGRAGEIGLMQVTPAAAGEWAKSRGSAHVPHADLFDPATNVAAGCWYLARAMRRWSAKADPVPYALAEYNAGRSNALRWSSGDEGEADRFRGAITYPSTRRYISDIVTRFRGP
jgi:soluble lytic murein transglycosylase